MVSSDIIPIPVDDFNAKFIGRIAKLHREQRFYDHHQDLLMKIYLAAKNGDTCAYFSKSEMSQELMDWLLGKDFKVARMDDEKKSYKYYMVSWESKV